MTDIPTGYEIRANDCRGHELLIDGQPFPWGIAADGPRVEGGRHGFHVLWVPILIDAPMGDGEPDGEPLVTDEAQSMSSAIRAASRKDS